MGDLGLETSCAFLGCLGYRYCCHANGGEYECNFAGSAFVTDFVVAERLEIPGTSPLLEVAVTELVG